MIHRLSQKSGFVESTATTRWLLCDPAHRPSVFIWKRRLFYFFIWKRRLFWLSVHTFPVRTVTENTSIQKHSPVKREIFWKRCFAVFVFTDESRVFENDHVTPVPLGRYFIYVNSSRAQLLVNAHALIKDNQRFQSLQRNVWARREKKSPFSNKNGNVWIRPDFTC